MNPGSTLSSHPNEAKFMKKTLIASLLAVITGGAVLTLLASEDYGEKEGHDAEAREYGDSREEMEHGKKGWLQDVFRDDEAERASTAWQSDARHALYQTECGSCHLAYPPAMLPAVSWQAIMAGLGDHFGENAELDLETRAQIENFLGEYAAGNGGGDYARRMWRATQGMAAPLRITETDYFVGKHHEIPRNMVVENPEVKSFSRCDACHTRADKGSFAEDEIRIPGYGRWDD